MITYGHLLILLERAEYAQSGLDDGHKHAHSAGLVISSPEYGTDELSEREGGKQFIKAPPSKIEFAYHREVSSLEVLVTTQRQA